MSIEPQITALVRADGTGEVSVNGEKFPVYATDIEGVRAAIIDRVIEEAVHRDHPVSVATTDLDGVYPLVVHPSGDVESSGPVMSLPQDAPNRADAPEATDSDATESDATDVVDSDATDVADADVADDTEGPDEADDGHTTAHRHHADPIRRAEPGPIPPPPFGFDGVVASASALAPASADGDETAEDDASRPARRSTFQPFETVTGVPAPADSDLNARLDEAIAETGPRRSNAEYIRDEAAAGRIPTADDAATPAATPAAPAPSHGLESFSPPISVDDENAPTLDDFLQSRPSASVGPARMGWQGLVGRITGGLISPRPGKAERAHRDAVERVQRSLRGPRTIVVLNPKGGAHKTTATLLLAATFGIHRGGSTLAWDNNETRGTLGWRAQPSRHSNTAVDLLRDLDKFADVKSARVGYLDSYVRAQGDAQFDVLASDEDAAASSTIDAVAFRSLHHTLSRFYRVLVIDTGNNMRASNWEAAVEAADQLVVVTTVNEETAASAAWLLDGLRQKGHQDKVSQAVTILSSPGDTTQPELSKRLHSHFSALTRVVLEVPYDPGFHSGGPLNVDVLSPQTREAWLQVTAAVADGL